MRKLSKSVGHVTPRNGANPDASPDPVAKPTKVSESTGTEGRPFTGPKGDFSSHSVRSDPGGG
jgi:hypothetical protein